MRAELLSVGTELLLGQIVDTNANYLAQELAALGIDLYFISQVGDNLQRLSETIRRALGRSDLLITTGGLGPTEDDLTREAIADALGETMAVDPELEAALRAHFERGGRVMPQRNVKQATLIPSASALPNPVGTAPGWWVEKDGRTIVSMPGVPHEMRRMWEEEARPRLGLATGATVILSRTLKLMGIGESQAEQDLGELVRSTAPTLATYAKPDGVHLRLTAKADTTDEALAQLDALEPLVRERVGEFLYGVESDTFPGAVGQLLRTRGLRLAVGESATGGSLASLITEATGAADYFLGGTVVYQAEVKEHLGVPPDVLEAHGTVSQETSAALAAAVRRWYRADVALATTGVAGPGPFEGQPEGTIHIALDREGSSRVRTLHYSTTREEFKRRGARDALYLLWRDLRDHAGAGD